MNMKKNTHLIMGFAVILFIAAICIIKPLKKDIWDINADNLRKSFNSISGTAVIEDFPEWTPFEWDFIYSFAPYSSKKMIYDIIGYKWDNIRETVNEGMEQTVFVKDGKVVCYLYGYPEYLKMGFHFGEYEGGYIKLAAEQKLSFKVTTSENGIRYLDYIK